MTLRSRIRLAAFGVSLFNAGLPIGCGSACDVPCASRVDLYFDGALEAPARYRVEIVTDDGTAAACETTVPERPVSDVAECDVDGAGWIRAGGRLVGVRVGGVPRLVEVHLFRDATVIGNAAIHPVYHQQEEPSSVGTHCADCFVAAEPVPLP